MLMCFAGEKDGRWFGFEDEYIWGFIDIPWELSATVLRSTRAPSTIVATMKRSLNERPFRSSEEIGVQVVAQIEAIIDFISSEWDVSLATKS